MAQDNIFIQRARSRVSGLISKMFQDADVKSVILAGGGLLREFSDLDFYPTADHKLQFEALISKQDRITKNSASIEVGGTLVQLCKYFKSDSAELIASFDYSHCQIAAVITFGDELDVSIVKSARFSEAMETESTEFTGSEYPLASMARLFKVSQKRHLSRIDTAGNMLRVMCAVIDRGFKDWQDFKDQLDAVDLRLGVKDLAGFEDDAKRLFELLKKG